MNQSVVINKLAKEFGLTSRTLRHWESEGLFKSTRDEFSGWRVYDEDAVLCIHITMILRKFDIPIAQIKKVISEKTIASLLNEIETCIQSLEATKEEITLKKEQLALLKQALSADSYENTSTMPVSALMAALDKAKQAGKKEIAMLQKDKGQLKIITLPPMRVVYHIAVSVSPEEEALAPVLEWLKAENLLGTARLLGGNMPPMPGNPSEPYGYGMCATIPENVVVPDNLKEMQLPGGLYALQESDDDIGVSWNDLMTKISKSEKYKADKNRLCFEEHLRNDTPQGSGNEYSLILLEPVKLR